jgi:hypothetical protein
MIVKINKNTYHVNDNEFNKIVIQEYCNLKILNDVGFFERLTSLFFELKNCNITNLLCFNTTHGGFLPINCSSFFDSITLINTSLEQKININNNIKNHNIQNITLSNDDFNVEYYKILNVNLNIAENNTSILFSNDIKNINIDFLHKNRENIIISKFNLQIINKKIFNYIFQLKNSDYFIYLNENKVEMFKETFKYYIEDDTSILNYDNLINLCIMVKNAGPQFEEMLIKNLPIIDRWTILDTGSTDETINIINRVLVGKKKGNLYQEPFINFCDSRNRLLELASYSCKYDIMLDDTYVVEGDLRSFLNEIRGDQYSNSFTLFIKSNDTKYGSNRIIKTNLGLHYVYKIHEVITDKNNINIVIPENRAIINDYRFDYMEKRTQERKQLDLQLLYEELEENYQNPRTYYYLAQTYNLLEQYDKSYEYFLKRAEFINAGFLQERVDAVFEAARIANFKLYKPWSECLSLYEKCSKIDESRPESFYFIGIHYYLENDYKKAYPYFKKGFEIGFPKHCQYSLKPTISFHFLPKFLTRICYELEDYILGETAAHFFILNNKSDADDYTEMVSWYNIYNKLNIYNGPKKINIMPDKPIFCFVADGGFNSWTGSTILTVGVGGSETYIIEMARWIQNLDKFNVYVFCNTPDKKSENFEEVNYRHLDTYYEFVNTNYIQHCIVSRFSEYLPVTFKGFTENVYFIVHDLTPSGIVIPINKKLKNVFCLTEWHVSYLNNIFPQLKDIIVPFYYGCNFNLNLNLDKIPFKFIYSSFPNRGLLQLLQMWPKIYEYEPRATLHIYSDINNKWSNDVEPEKMQEIHTLLENYSSNFGIYYHGWVSKKELVTSWQTADIWFYPCTFMETFCLTALEAAHSKTFVITNDLAALQNTVGNRGAIIKGDPTTNLWQEEALEQIMFYLNPLNIEAKNELIERNYKWATNLTWENQANKLIKEYIEPNAILEYKGMYNWTNDVPFSSKQIFLDTINYFNENYEKVKNRENIKVLEFGTYTGISLINIIKLIPNSSGVGVDMWTSYNENNLLENMDALEIEKSFYNNIKISGLENRIMGFKTDSTNALLNYIQEGKKFDFIYIDGSHLLLDCYSDLVLSWQILEKDGILAIDDYFYKQESILDSPFEAVNHFLTRYEGKYKLLHKGYRVFLEKSTF